MRARVVRLVGACGGALSVEFALIGVAFCAMLLVCFQLGFLLYAQNALDFAAKQAGRQLMTGRVVPPPKDQAGFQSAVFCPFLSSFLDCSGVVIRLRPVADFASGMAPPLPNPDGSDYDAGDSGSLMLLQAVYTSPITAWPLNVPTLTGTAAFRNQ